MKVSFFFYHVILFSFSSLGLKPAESWRINFNDNSDKKFIVGKFNFFTEDGRLLVYFLFFLDVWLFYYLDHLDESNPIVLSNEELINALKKFQPIGKYLIIKGLYIGTINIFIFKRKQYHMSPIWNLYCRLVEKVWSSLWKISAKANAS